MKKYVLLLFLAAILMMSCSENHTSPDKPDADVASNKVDSFFPVTSFLKGQIALLDSLPVTPLQIIKSNNNTDSTWITKAKLMEILGTFVNPVISERNMVDYFKETKFNDQTLNEITFTYEPSGKIPDSISLRQWNVYVKPENGNVDKVYIVKDIKNEDRLYTIQLTWQTNKQAKIVTILKKNDGNSELLTEEYIIWDFHNNSKLF